MQELVSIIITAYKAEELIHRSVLSALNQTHQNLEILVISDDLVDYKKILLEKNISDGRIKFISTGMVGAGQAKALNLGLEKANSNYIANLDFDDEFHPQRIKILLPLVKKYGAATSGLEFIEDDTKIELNNLGINFKKDFLLFKEFLLATIHCYTNIIFDKNRVKSNFNPNYIWAMDFVSIANMFNYIDRFGYSPKKLIKYYRRSGSLCNSQNSVNNFISDYEKAISELEQGILEIKNPEIRKTLRNYLISMIAIEKEYLKDLEKNKENKFNETLKRWANYLKKSITE